MLRPIHLVVTTFVAAGALAAGAGGCEIFSSVDRSQVGTGTSSGAGGAGGATTSATTSASTTTSTGSTGGGGSGGCTSVSDCPDPGTACVVATCDMGTCKTVDAATGTACTGSGKVCDGKGVCVACLADADCGPGSTCNTSTHTCMGDLCSDGIKNGTETDKDCGGSACPACADGLLCTGDADCQNGHCFDGVCCHTTCGGTCSACNVPGSVGMCTALPGGSTDPNGATSCSGNSRCDGNGNCLAIGGAACAMGNECLSGMCGGTGICQCSVAFPQCTGGGTCNTVNGKCM